MRSSLALLTVSALLTATRIAHACGSSADGVAACDLAEHDEATRPRWRVGASALFTSTSLRFGGAIRGDETRLSTLASIAYAPSARVTLHAGAGAALGGRLAMPDGAHDFAPGPAAAIGVSWRAIDARPFLVLTSLLSFTGSTTRRDGDADRIGYEAFDLRLGALFGTTLWDVLSPYALARVFGGPVFWRYAGDAVTGTDAYHYQLGAGLALAIATRVSAFVEGVPLGERAVAAGASIAF